MLDIATGTGGLCYSLCSNAKTQPSYRGGYLGRMMEIGRQKVEKAQLGSIVSFMKEDCMNLSFHNERFDAVTAAFGIRTLKTWINAYANCIVYCVRADILA